jgi:hypothetical protein
MSRITEKFVDLFARNDGLHAAIQIFGTDLQHSSHPTHINTDTAEEGGGSTFKPSAGSVGNHKTTVMRANFYDCADLIGRVCEGDRRRPKSLVIILITGTLFAYRCCRRQPVAEKRFELGDNELHLIRQFCPRSHAAPIHAARQSESLA